MEQQMTFFLALAVGLIFGGFLVWLMLRADTNNAYARAKSEMVAEHTALTERLSGREARIEDLTKERDQLRTELQRLREENADFKATNAELETRVDDSAKVAEEKLAVVNEARQQIAESFRAISAEALQSNNQAFLDLAKEAIAQASPSPSAEVAPENRKEALEEMVGPLREALDRVDRNIQEMERSSADTYAGISEQVKTLLDTQNLLRSEASNLVNVLRAPTVRGRWGELQLRRVAELAGMVPYCDFVAESAGEANGGPPMPDMTVRLPNGRQVVVDAKVSLQAYLEALESQDESTRQSKMQEHATEVRAHVEKLSTNGYWEQFPAAPEFVVAFVPGESFFTAALQQDPELIEFGVRHNVILSTPTTLIALLKAVAYGWSQERLTASAEEISDLGKNLYGRIRTFAKHLEDVSQSLQRTVTGYNRAVGSLESRVLPAARRFEDLVAVSKGDIPSVPLVDSFPQSLRAIEQAVESDWDTDRSEESAEPEPVDVDELVAAAPALEDAAETAADEEVGEESIGEEEVAELAPSEPAPDELAPDELAPGELAPGEPQQHLEEHPEEPVLETSPDWEDTPLADAPASSGGEATGESERAVATGAGDINYTSFVKTS